MQDTCTLETATVDLTRRLQAWRDAHRARTPIPAELWDKALDLAAEQGLYKTARALHLDYGALKKRAELRASGSSRGPAFVECRLPSSPTISECSLEVESFQGVKLRVQMKSVPAADLVSILRGFVSGVTP